MFKTLKKNLVISTVGDKSIHKNWSEPNDLYDTFLIYYGDQEGFEGECNYYKRQNGYKYPLIQQVIKENPWIYDYEYIWLPDDDVYTTPLDVSRLFDIMKQYDLWAAQPSIMGWYSIDATLHQQNSILRYTNWIEIMCPCFSSKALKICEQSFNENNTGWSIEGVWNVLLNHPKDKIAIIDDVIVVHTRQVLTGDTYKDKIDPLDFALSEGRAVHQKWNLGHEYSKDVQHGTLIQTDINFFVLYNQIKKDRVMGPDMSQRIFPNGDVLKQLIAKAS